MPVTHRSIYDKRAGDQRYQSLKQRLVAEWSETGGSAPAPDIMEEEDAQGRVVHVIVTWDDWADLDAQTRSELIVEAFKEVKGEAAIIDLILAMGLTKAEAARLARA